MSAAKDVESVGKRKKGKDQLRYDELKRWLNKAHELAAQGSIRAAGALAIFYTGVRPGEIVKWTVREGGAGNENEEFHSPEAPDAKKPAEGRAKSS